MESNSENKKDGYESEYESDLEDQEAVKEAATNLMKKSSELSPKGKEIIGDFTEEVLVSTSIYQTPSSEPIYAVSQKGNNASRNDTPPPLPSSPPPLRSESGHVDMSGRHGSDRGVSSEASNNFQQCFNNGSERLRSGSISEGEMSDAVGQAAGAVCTTESQRQLENQIKNDRSFLDKIKMGE